MTDEKTDNPADPAADEKPDPKPATGIAKEINGRGGLDPTRYGDWEKGGLAVDF